MKQKSIYTLGAMMFLQYLMFAVWWVPLGAYLSRTLQLEVYQVSLVLSSMAIGSMASPLIGTIADRYFPAEKVLAVLNLMTAAMLFAATTQTTFPGMFVTITLAMLCYMPTWSLTSSIAMTHIKPELFPRVRLLGSIGWVASGLFSLAAIHIFGAGEFDVTPLPLYCGAATAVAAALLDLFLPKTPPKGDRREPVSVRDIFGFGILATLKSRDFNRFILLSFLAVIPFTLYHVYGSIFFAEENVRNITVTMNWGQLAEMVFLFVTTSILVRYGFRKAMMLGLAAMMLRYGSLWLGVEVGQQWLYSIGILTHGLIFGLFFIVGQVYTDRIAPPERRAQAQGFLAFVVWGVGYLIATLGNGWLIEAFRRDGVSDWSSLFGISFLATAVLTLLFAFLFRPSPSAAPDK